MRTIQSELNRIKAATREPANGDNCPRHGGHGYDDFCPECRREWEESQKRVPTADSPVAYPMSALGVTVERDELQRLLEQCFENSRRVAQEREYHEWLDELDAESRNRQLELEARDREESEREQRIRDL